MNYIFPFAYFNIKKPNHKYLTIKIYYYFKKDFPNRSFFYNFVRLK